MAYCQPTERPGYVAPRVYSGVNYGKTIRVAQVAPIWAVFLLAISTPGATVPGTYTNVVRSLAGLSAASWGNASTGRIMPALWLRVDGNPEAGAIMQNGGGYGQK